MIDKELAAIIAIAWYIKVELLCTAQLPDCMTYARLYHVTALVKDIKEQVGKVYSSL